MYRPPETRQSGRNSCYAINVLNYLNHTLMRSQNYTYVLSRYEGLELSVQNFMKLFCVLA